MSRESQDLLLSLCMSLWRHSVALALLPVKKEITWQRSDLYIAIRCGWCCMMWLVPFYILFWHVPQDGTLILKITFGRKRGPFEKDRQTRVLSLSTDLPEYVDFPAVIVCAWTNHCSKSTHRNGRPDVGNCKEMSKTRIIRLQCNEFTNKSLRFMFVQKWQFWRK